MISMIINKKYVLFRKNKSDLPLHYFKYSVCQNML